MFLSYCYYIFFVQIYSHIYYILIQKHGYQCDHSRNCLSKLNSYEVDELLGLLEVVKCNKTVKIIN